MIPLQPMETSHWSSLSLKDCIPWREPTPVRCLKDCIPQQGPHAGAGEKREEVGAAQRSCYRLTANLILHLPVLLREEEEVKELE